jgi:hypothetical protein
MKLRARDTDDLAILSACLQDALVNVREMQFLPSERRFVFVANRFRWETGDRSSEQNLGRPADTDADAPFEGDDGDHARYERTHCGVCFELVRAVQSRGLRGPFRARFLELLALQVASGAILLCFAGGATVRLEVDGIRVYLEDLGEAWPTAWRPAHALDQTGSSQE